MTEEGKREIDPWQERWEAVNEQLENLENKVDNNQIGLEAIEEQRIEDIRYACKTRIALTLLWAQVNLGIFSRDADSAQRAFACTQYLRETFQRPGRANFTFRRARRTR